MDIDHVGEWAAAMMCGVWWFCCTAMRRVTVLCGACDADVYGVRGLQMVRIFGFVLLGVAGVGWCGVVV